MKTNKLTIIKSDIIWVIILATIFGICTTFAINFMIIKSHFAWDFLFLSFIDIILIVIYMIRIFKKLKIFEPYDKILKDFSAQT
ncbi:MAG: hypothetical protein WC554_09170 [Clostridia bacterium]